MQGTEATLYSRFVRMQPPLATNCSWNSLFLLQHTEVWVVRGQPGSYPNISGFGLKEKILRQKPLASTYWNNRTTSTCDCEWMSSCLRAGLTWVRLKARGLVSNWFLSKQSKNPEWGCSEVTNDQSTSTASGMKNNTAAQVTGEGLMMAPKLWMKIYLIVFFLFYFKAIPTFQKR